MWMEIIYVADWCLRSAYYYRRLSEQDMVIVLVEH